MAMEVNGLRTVKGGVRGEEVYKGRTLIGWLGRQPGGTGHGPLYRGVTSGCSTVAEESWDRDEALGNLEEAWREDVEASERSGQWPPGVRG